MNSNIEQTYISFLTNIKQRIRDAQYVALKAVNKEQIQLNWDLGKMIVEKQEQLGWGKSVVEQLSKDLQEEFPGQRGWSSQNLWYMRQFYLEYHDKTNLQPLVGEIGWTHNILIMSKCKDDLQREFYIRMTAKYGWTKDVLIHQIEAERNIDKSDKKGSITIYVGVKMHYLYIMKFTFVDSIRAKIMRFFASLRYTQNDNRLSVFYGEWGGRLAASPPTYHPTHRVLAN